MYCSCSNKCTAAEAVLTSKNVLHFVYSINMLLSTTNVITGIKIYLLIYN